MHIELNREDVLKLIDTGEISKPGATITLRDNRQARQAALQPRHTDYVDLPARPHVRGWEPAREMQMRRDNPLHS